jgi:branched-chain amino acid transport system ATP-binding protein
MENGTADKAASSVVLQLDDVWASYDGVMPILQGVNLSLQKGKIFALLGGNGAGKSTTLKAVAGLLKVTSGRIMFGGDDISKLRPHQIVSRGIAFAVQGKDVFPSMSVDENLRLGAFSRSDKAAINEDADQLYDQFPSLKKRRDQPAAILSGGERQMLVMARGLMARPQVFLIDEPSAALAPKVVDEVMQAISDLRAKGLSILLVEQNVNAALDIADHFFVLREGRVVADGDASQRGRFEEIKKIYFGVVMGDAPTAGMPLA